MESLQPQMNLYKLEVFPDKAMNEKICRHEFISSKLQYKPEQILRVTNKCVFSWLHEQEFEYWRQKNDLSDEQTY